ncbi:uncharacterized protein [Nicotiana tomentosiformis]|uniref:uncharacterized protein n=1 Tax=Nicotiana tomentosiformis TaxID=4098 RepID=UPI00388C7F27
MAEESKKLTSRVQSVEDGKGIDGLNYEDLCIQLDVELPEGYKPPKFEMFDGIGVGKDERIRMKLFMRSLTGDALSWFNTENAPDVFYIQNLKKKPTETFSEYATRWRSEAMKVRPALEEEQMNKFFVKAQDPQYYERLMVIENHKFSDIIKLGERIEEGINSGMVTNFKALQDTNKAFQSGGISKKKEVGTVMVAQGPKSSLTYKTPPPAYQPSPPRYQQPVASYHTYNTQPTYYHSPPPARQNYQKPRPNFDRKPPRQYTLIPKSIDQLYERLKAADYVTPIPTVAMENSSQWINPNKTCAYHSGMKGHTIEECRTLKDKIETLIDTKVIQAKETAPNVRNNPLPDHRGDGVNVIETDKEWDLEGSIGLIQEGHDPKTSPVTLIPIIVKTQVPIEVEVGAPMPFEVEISILSLLQNSETHRNSLMKVLSEAYVPTNITSGEMANMVGQVLESHKITSHKDELPPEGPSHNRELHIIVQLEDKFIARVLIDGGSSLNICPLTTLKRLGKGLHEIRARSMNVKAFDGS